MFLPFAFNWSSAGTPLALQTWRPRWFSRVSSRHFGITPLLGSHFNFELLNSAGAPLALRPDAPDDSLRGRLVTLESHLFWDPISTSSC